MGTVAIGFATHLGWACVAVVRATGTTAEVLHTGRIETAPQGNLAALEPFHVAGGFQGLERVPAPADPAAVVADGLAQQLQATGAALDTLFTALEAQPQTAAVITARGRPAASLQQAIASHSQIHIAEGNAVRETLRQACAARGLAVHNFDRKDLLARLPELELPKPASGPWRAEERLCTLAAWTSLS